MAFGLIAAGCCFKSCGEGSGTFIWARRGQRALHCPLHSWKFTGILGTFEASDNQVADTWCVDVPNKTFVFLLSSGSRQSFGLRTQQETINQSYHCTGVPRGSRIFSSVPLQLHHYL